MKIKKLLPSIYSILFGVGMIFFSFYYSYYFSEVKFYKLQEGIPLEFGVTNPLADLSDTTAITSPFYKIKFKEGNRVFVMRMFGRDYNVPNMDSLLATGKKTGILFHDEKNENGQYDIYKITQNGKEIYSFNKHFSSAGSKTIMWILLVTGIVFATLGIFSFRMRKNEKEMVSDEGNV
jgi:hypothetical protein